MVPRPRLVERLNEGLRLDRKLTLLSASAGSGKTTLLSEWVAVCGRPVAWLSLDEGDNDPARFLTYFVAALQTIAPNIGTGVLGVLQSPQPPSTESILTTLLNEASALSSHVLFVLEDYHIIDSKPVDDALLFMLEHLPPPMHLVIATREDPRLPLARLRTRDQLSELRVADLRFTPSEAAEFLNQAMGLGLSSEDIVALETRTEGWIAGLQLAAISMRGHPNPAEFIQSFTGSHQFVLDYLMEEVLQRQSEAIQKFLLQTSILDRLCGSLCDTVVPDPAQSGQATLEHLVHANLFIVPLDNERRWYRYHHLFADLLRQRLRQSTYDMADLHQRASAWYEGNDLEIEAFQHAAAAGDVDRAARLIQGRGMPLHVRGGAVPVVSWLESLPRSVLDARPVLWLTWANALTTIGQTVGVEQKLQAAEAAVRGAKRTIENRDLLGRIANNRAVLAVSQYQSDTAIEQAHRALEYLRQESLPIRATATWALGVAYQHQGDRPAATQAFTEAISTSQAIGYSFVTKLATIGLGLAQEQDNQLYLSAKTYSHALQLFGDQPLPFACEAHVGLARIHYEWNDLDAAERHAGQAMHLARQYADIIDRFIVVEVFLARLMLTQGDVAGAAALLAEAEQAVRRHNFVYRAPEVAAAQVHLLLRQGDLAAAMNLAQSHDLPISRARVHLAQGDPAAALKVLAPLPRQVEAKGWDDERLRVMILQAVALHAHSEEDKAVQFLGEALAMAEPGGFLRIFLDEGAPMAELLSIAASRRIHPEYVGKLLAGFEFGDQTHQDAIPGSAAEGLIEPLSPRELEILQLLARGLSNQQISARLFLALSTVKGHNRSIFNKLQAQSRTEAVARARELGLL